MRKIEEKYATEVAVIGVHSAKFPNEKAKENLYQAVQRHELRHPVLNDGDFHVWRAYACRAWPTMMFIDPEGKVIGKHEGEISYESLDKLMGDMVVEFDDQGLLNRTALAISVETEPDRTLSFPGKVLADGPGGRLFIADTNHNRILVTSLEGAVKQVIGSGRAGLDDGSFSTATFNHPQGMALDGNALYVADAENHTLRKVDLTAERVETIAGNGNQGSNRETRGPGLAMELNSPWDLVYHAHALYIAMAGLHQLWSMTLGDGQIGPYAGSGGESITDGPRATAMLAQPSGIASDGTKLYFVDSETSSVRTADLNPNGRVGTIVGQDLFVFGDVDGTEDKVRLQHPIGIAYQDGIVYIADTYNHKIKKILPNTRSSFTLLGSGEAGHQDGPGHQAKFSEPSGISFAGGKLFIADTNNHLIRVADLEADRVWTLEISGV
ncbi:MAG: alkyl hydroperoxide reductase [Chloroflexi bacterium]|nr:alkyl hydroperoxide reductase [Chloroflexota bacterium]MDA1219098.1 alkyl hydroperoxide reductase [Chloroflexota bacterium]PKB57623.1 MAG: alkyl hydroperoxide reductase [SAR202 cluster bacterium Casp-Chloro-G3]